MYMLMRKPQKISQHGLSFIKGLDAVNRLHLLPIKGEEAIMQSRGI